MLTKIYKWVLRLTSRPGEKGEYSGGYLPNRIRQEVLDLCKSAQGSLLEIGCGEGLFLAQIAKQNPKLNIWGIDNDDARLNAAAFKLPGLNLSHQDALELSFQEGYFDTVICINVLFNLGSIEEIKRILKEMKRVSKKEASLIFDFRNALNPLLFLKYRLAKYYDLTLKGLPLKTYTPGEIKSVLKELEMVTVRERFIGFNFKFLAAAIVLEVKNT